MPVIHNKPVNGIIPWKTDFKRNWSLYLIFVPVLVYFVLFNYLPMFGIVMAFQDFKISRGFLGSAFVGLRNFIELFTGETFGLVMRNTIVMSLLNLTIGYVAPIIFAIIITEAKLPRFKRAAAVVSYIPNFIAAVVVAQLTREFLSRSGSITGMLAWFGFDKQNWLANSDVPVFWIINTIINIWIGLGYGSRIFVAAISNVNADLYEASAIDGAGRLRRLFFITLPCITPMIVMMFTLRIGLVFVVGFDKILLLYMPTTYATADVLTTYTYRMAFGMQTNYSLSSASGLFQSVIGTILLLISNWLSKKATSSSLI